MKRKRGGSSLINQLERVWSREGRCPVMKKKKYEVLNIKKPLSECPKFDCKKGTNVITKGRF